MHVDIITIFPSMFDSVLNSSILKRAVKKGKLRVTVNNLRDYAEDKHNTTDDAPYGGGAGMVMKVEPIAKCLKSIEKKKKGFKILLTPAGKKFDQKMAIKLAKKKNLILVCGHYEGFDERVKDYIDEEVSIGDFVLTGGEVPALVVIDAVVRLLPGVLGNKESAKNESFMADFLDYPHYTRPADYKGKKVPEVLLSGNHKAIAKWRSEEALKLTKEKRPDLLKEKTNI
ncbi:MAG: tRNA (guanosine(37)-N1)-methyltransferase TrmD [Candidatus Firestonebacteria bacterium]|nr:tRNA (guanosine(37)-N1)-methyltransferase TrmD [Candidatus Firestonebacteria bacterium]